MNDWNGNGSYDSADRYIDYKMSGGSSGGHSGGGSGKGVWIYILAAMIIGAICEPIGVLMLIGLYWVWICGGL